MPRPINSKWKIIVASLSVVSFRYFSVLDGGRLTSNISIYHLFASQIYHIVFSPVCQLLEFRLWMWNMAFFEMEITELGRSTWNDTHNTRLLIRTPQVCPRHRCRQKNPLPGKSINTHIYKHTSSQHLLVQSSNRMFRTTLEQIKKSTQSPFC